MSAFMDSCQVNCVYLDFVEVFDVYLDFAEAFDKFNHCLLIAMLEGYEVRGSLLRWLESYIKDRVPIGSSAHGQLRRLYLTTLYHPVGSTYPRVSTRAHFC